MAAALRRIAGEKCFMLSSIRAKLVAAPTALFIWQRGITTKLFVGGLSIYTTENGLSEAFSQYGQVVEAKIVMDRALDRSKGFGFVTYASEDEAQKALDEMNGKSLNGRVIYVDYAKLKTNFGGGIPIARGPPEPTTSES
ncbi:PREDICTED: glycine-rich RNA-binding protein 4, mitochondrial-like [Populus euphratica]|uniref:Glycine-rich RNA-binding protein 4, mitochondrial-like n=1 Tax=Populus euphratica TaxID=75702 RepID=A0AAJ6VGZ3_POPEU|nr:PREDICTED: glycine-rich RNA-binding protein 4, mitochondrial-like [Populus euphratica]XP_011046925.1 PREDICTED: glycine-rich RNA-binding protein 4, mitochondrial-like [Populus euphratica]